VILANALTFMIDGGNMKSFRYYRFALPEEAVSENKNVREIFKAVCIFVLLAFLATAVVLLSR
jgi:hypothetical protein